LNQRHQVTDPLLFDGPFIYNLTRQERYARLRELTPGDLVIFGARSHCGFLLDTVFVVGKKFSYDQGRSLHPSTSTVTRVSVDPLIRPTDGRGTHPQERPQFSWYNGATPDDRSDGMYSFTPALPHVGTPQTFSRPVVSDCAGITNTMPVQYLHAPPREVWMTLAQRTCAFGLGLGTALHTWPHPADPAAAA
jgi:hypothetical protein